MCSGLIRSLMSFDSLPTHEGVMDLCLLRGLVESDFEVARSAILVDTSCHQAVHVDLADEKRGSSADLVIRLQDSRIDVHVMLWAANLHDKREWQDGGSLLIHFEEVLVFIVGVEVDVADLVAAGQDIDSVRWAMDAHILQLVADLVHVRLPFALAAGLLTHLDRVLVFVVVSE